MTAFPPKSCAHPALPQQEANPDVQAPIPSLHRRNRAEIPVGREEIKQGLTRKSARELDDRLIKEIRAVSDNRIAVRVAYA